MEERVNLFYEIKLKPMEMRIRRSFVVIVFVSFVFIKYCQTFSHSKAFKNGMGYVLHTQGFHISMIVEKILY